MLANLIGRARYAVLFLFVSAFAGLSVAQTPAAAYGRLPSIGSGAISPDGSKLALLQANGDQYALSILSTQTFARIGALLPGPGEKLEDLTWANDDAIVLWVRTTHNVAGAEDSGSRARRTPSDRLWAAEFSRAFAVSADGKQVTPLLAGGENDRFNLSAGAYWPPSEDDPQSVYMTRWEASVSAVRLNVKRVNLQTGFGVDLASGASTTYGFILNRNRAPIGRLATSPASNTWYLETPAGNAWERKLTGVSETGISDFDWSVLADGRLAKLDEGESGARLGLTAIDPATGKSERLFEHPRFDVETLVHDPRTGTIVGIEYAEDFPTQFFFDPALADVAKAVVAKFAGGYARLIDWDRARQVFLVRGEGRGLLPGVYLYHADTDALRLVSVDYPELAPADYGARKAIQYKARDGAPIAAYLTLPQGAQPKGLPLVVMPHGGPHARDTFAFDYIAAFLASRGYGVLQPNFRGSSGYGVAFRNAGRGEWGGRMQDDVTDGVNALIDAGIADARRICIVGASYGGYSALIGATRTPDKYACAVSIAGVSDLKDFLVRNARRSGGSDSASSDWWRLSIGNLREDAARLHGASPIEHIASLRAPVLLMHGQKDTVVDIGQSRRFARSAEAAGKSVTLIELDGDDHWLSFASTRTRVLQEMDTFLAQYLAPVSTAP